MSAESKVAGTIEEHGLLSIGDSVLVALSGGPDSVALLHLLCRLRQRYKLKLAAVYINHNIRKRAAKKEEQFCHELCDRLSVKFHLVAEDIPALAKATRKSVEQAARDFRYETFERLSREHRYDRIALGHHADDQVETVLFRVLRGTGITGLRGIPAKRGKIIRPLYYLTKDEITAYLKKQELKYCIDTSNAKTEYRRNYLRNRLLREIRKNLNPAVDSALLNLAETAAEDDAFLRQHLSRFVRSTVGRTVGGKIELDLTKFNRYDKWLRRRLLRYCLAELSRTGQAPEKAVVDRLDSLALGSGKELSVPDGLRATLAGKMLLIYRPARRQYKEPLRDGRLCRLEALGLNFRTTVCESDGDRLIKERRSTTVVLDYEKLGAPLFVRNIRSGDRFRPLGAGGTKKVGDYLTDRKVPRVYRDEIPVVCDDEGIVWLVGYEIADRVKVDSGTRKVLKIDVTKRSKRRTEAV